jgi:hypothetical protein
MHMNLQVLILLLLFLRPNSHEVDASIMSLSSNDQTHSQGSMHVCILYGYHQEAELFMVGVVVLELLRGVRL